MLSAEQQHRLLLQRADNNNHLMKGRSINAPVGGLGDLSYARNSSNQGNALKSLYPALQNSVLHDLIIRSPPDHGIVRLADFGCSSGMNSINNMHFLIHTLQQKFRELGPVKEEHVIEFQVFLSDLPSNDFNTLFNLWIDHSLDIPVDDECKNGRSNWSSYFIAGVPGSFYNRLFPRSSLHVAFSSMALHWLSRVPEEVVERDSPAWNGGHVWIQDANPRAAEAYAKLAKTDLGNFLNARSEELIPGGLLFLFFPGRSLFDPTKQYQPEDTGWITILSTTWNKLVADGIIQPEARDYFNVPAYLRTKEEVLEVVSETPKFELIRLELLDVPILGAQKHEIGSVEAHGRQLTKSFRTLLGGYVENHLGSDKAEVFHQRMEENAIAYVKARPERKVAYKDHILLILRQRE